ncbi:hypothetical protein [Serinicoccus kebangsaanensis]|nr:hypothetical protein [Serinicoccus kebangsaanensis]
MSEIGDDTEFDDWFFCHGVQKRGLKAAGRRQQALAPKSMPTGVGRLWRT